jgi:isoleucyl-tRNA synthetase
MRTGSPAVNLPEMEKDILAEWEKDRTFYKSNERRKGKKEFSFYDGPPFANGLPHYGHILGQTLKDIVPRYWNMRGYFVERRFGWDCHGLPVEFEVEKKQKLNGRKDILKLGVDKFNEECRKTVFHYAGEWQKTVTRLGRWVDWNNQYRTMDRDFMESVWWALSELYKKGLVYRDLKIVAYSPRITAVVSNFEANLNYKDVQDPSVTVKFKLRDEDAYLLAWTTTPWTLVSNLGLAINPDVPYVKVKDNETNEVYYLAKDRLDFVYKPNPKNPVAAYDILETVPAQKFAGRSFLPLFDFFKNQANAFKIFLDSYVTLDSGTGVVQLAPAYGEDDFRICKANHIEIVDPLDDEAHFTQKVPDYQGQYIKDADKNIIKDLKSAGKILRHDTLVHSYPHCDRTEQPLIYRAIPTWYVAVEKIKQTLVANNQTINWIPSHLRDGRMGQWLENARDWAISRNRFWGTPLPIWICSKDDHHRVVIGAVADLEKRVGEKIPDLHKHHVDAFTFKCEQCSGTMTRVSEVFDCWFESGSMPYSQKHYPFENAERFNATFPADFIAEGLDQTRGWFYTLTVLAGALFQKPAFKNVIVNGIVLAQDGKKMSKRLGNYTAPDILLDKFGADSVRLYMLNSAVIRGEDLKFTDEGVKDTTRAVLLPLWNAYSFLSTYAEADGWNPDVSLTKSIAPKVKNEMDRWIISRFQTLAVRVHEQMEVYKLYLVVPEVLDFIEDLTNWYIRLSRRRFWGSDGKISDDTRDAYQTLYFVILEFTKIFAPFAPFISERIYKNLTEGLAGVEASVHLTDMPLSNPELMDANLEAQMALVRRATNLGRSLRAKHQIKTRQVLPSMLVITRNAADGTFIEKGAAIIKEELNVKEIQFSTDEAQYVRLSVKPNLRTLGKRLGAELGKFRTYLEALNGSHDKVAKMLEALDSDGKVTWETHELTPEDFLIERGPKEERLIATEKGVTILLDTTLTKDLILEGLSREVVNRIQKLRKDSGLNVSDRIQLWIFADGEIAEAAKSHSQYIANETLAVKVDMAPSQKAIEAAKFSGVFDIDGANCSIGVAVVAG